MHHSLHTDPRVRRRPPGGMPDSLYLESHELSCALLHLAPPSRPPASCTCELSPNHLPIVPHARTHARTHARGAHHRSAPTAPTSAASRRAGTKPSEVKSRRDHAEIAPRSRRDLAGIALSNMRCAPRHRPRQSCRDYISEMNPRDCISGAPPCIAPGRHPPHDSFRPDLLHPPPSLLTAFEISPPPPPS